MAKQLLYTDDEYEKYLAKFRSPARKVAKDEDPRVRSGGRASGSAKSSEEVLKKKQELITGLTDLAELRELAKGHSVTSSITAFLFHPNFPVDVRHNVKISRDMLALWAEERMR